jgi:hypothetical protein
MSMTDRETTPSEGQTAVIRRVVAEGGRMTCERIKFQTGASQAVIKKCVAMGWLVILGRDCYRVTEQGKKATAHV